LVKRLRTFTDLCGLFSKAEVVQDNFTAICQRCGSLYVSQPYGPPRPVVRIVLLFYLLHCIE
jgi:hypothetical protein